MQRTTMNKILKNTSGLYFVEGQGFVATAQAASRFDLTGAESKVACAASMGFQGITVEDGPANKSFGVCYLRKADLVAGKPTADALNNPLNPSRRRFATEAEADKPRMLSCWRRRTDLGKLTTRR
jgi:hypothetical protein